MANQAPWDPIEAQWAQVGQMSQAVECLISQWESTSPSESRLAQFSSPKIRTKSNLNPPLSSQWEILRPVMESKPFNFEILCSEADLA